MHPHPASCARIVRHVTLGRSYLCKHAQRRADAFVVRLECTFGALGLSCRLIHEEHAVFTMGYHGTNGFFAYDDQQL